MSERVTAYIVEARNAGDELYRLVESYPTLGLASAVRDNLIAQGVQARLQIVRLDKFSPPEIVDEDR